MSLDHPQYQHKQKSNTMKNYLYITIMAAFFVIAANQALAQGEAARSFESIKSLKGEWEGTNPAGNPVKMTYEVFSGGSAVMETLQPQGEPSMITVYHMDDGKLMMTHYCSAGNQPRMLARISGERDKEIDFNFTDGTNMKTHSGGHMQSLTIVFKDKDHIEQVWTFRQGGKDKPGTFKLRRKS